MPPLLLRIGAPLLLAGALTIGQDPQQQVFRGRLETVAVPVTVLNAFDEPVTALEREDFTILDDGRAQAITTFSRGLQAVRAVALVDVSASMMSSIDLALLAAEQLVIRLRPGDAAKVGLFSQRVDISPRFTGDRDALLGWLRQSLPFSNPTRLFDAIDAAITDLLPQPDRRVVVVFTDGCDTASATTWPAVLRRIYTEEVMVYAVMFRPRIIGRPPPERTLSFGAPMPPSRSSSSGAGPCTLHHHLELSRAIKPAEFLRVDDPRWTKGARLVNQLADETGGRWLQLTPDDDINRLFTSLMTELHHVYLLGFTPDRLDGKVHELTVRVTDPDLVVRHRQHYLAPGPEGRR